jgi:biopolymer transport protein TolR
MAMTSAPGPQMNVTPMIDILLVLIIVFMVLQYSSTGLPTDVPQPSAEQRPAEVRQDVVLTVEGAGRVKVNQDSIPVAELQTRLSVILIKTGVKPVLFIRGNRDLAFQEVAEVIDLAKGVGFTRIALMNDAR